MTFSFLHLYSVIFPMLLFGCSVTKKMADGSTGTPREEIPFDDTRPGHWPEPFQLVGIPSTLDQEVQQAWYFTAEGAEPKPLLVSLHTWSGNYNQADPLAEKARQANWNYIHPDFRGPNWTLKACCSEWALNDIDEAIDYALQNGNVDPARIYVAGVSGGGYAALAVYMKSRHNIRHISAWVPISDLTAWYEQSVIRGAKYAKHILECTGSGDDELDEEKARSRSPIFWKTPDRDTRLDIHAGIYDGIQGSVPITQSINFYNKLVIDMGAEAKGQIVSTEEKAWLLEHRKPRSDVGMIGDRKICLREEFKRINLVIFEGNHEMLADVVFEEFFND